jgi:hypothetical protein
MGIKNGLPAIDARLRAPVADRLYLSTADGGRCITDAVRETYEICRLANQLGQVEPIPIPKHGARFHFELPGSLQGFRVERGDDISSELVLSNVPCSGSSGKHSLALDFKRLQKGRQARIATPTFIPPDSKDASHYSLMACPTLYPGNVVKGRLIADTENSAPVRVAPFIAYYGSNDQLAHHHRSPLTLDPGVAEHFQWPIEELNGAPIAQFGIEVRSDSAAVSGRVYVDYIDWSGTPTTLFRRPDGDGKMWVRAWINAVDHVGTRWASAFHLSQNRGTGLFIQGSREWQNYAVQAAITSDPAKSFGLAARVQGLTRYYALILAANQTLQLVRNYDSVEVLAEVPCSWSWSQRYHFNLEVNGTVITGSLNGSELIRHNDSDAALLDGGIALLCEEGLIMTDEVKVISGVPKAN